MMRSQELWHLVDKWVILLLHRNLEVTPKYLERRVSQVVSGHSKALSSSTSSLSSSNRKDAKIKVATASLQAKQQAERVKRGNEVHE